MLFLNVMWQMLKIITSMECFLKLHPLSDTSKVTFFHCLPISFLCFVSAYCYLKYFIFLFLLNVCVCGVWDGIQGLMHAKHTLYHCTTSPEILF
jgi:hypothetical protein